MPRGYVATYSPWVESLAKGLLRRLPAAYALDDMVQEGMKALIKMHRKYDKDRGVAFKAYARSRVRGAMIDYLRRLNGTRCSEAKRVRMVSLNAPAGKPESEGEFMDILEARDGMICRLSVRTAMEEILTPREREVVERYYFHGDQIREIARDLGVTPWWMSRVHRAALKKLKSVDA